MKILTENPIVVIKEGMPLKGVYSSAEGDYSEAGGLKKAVKKGAQGAKGLVGSGKVSGILAALNPQGGAPTTQPLPPPPPAKTPMSTGMKVGIAVGIAAVVGIIIYVVVKKKKK